MNEVERYLERATWGLWGRKRREVREELESHLFERITAHRIAGVSEEDAIERVLRELGEPEEVSAGMMKLYTAPWMAGSGVLLAAICTLAVITFSDSLAQSLPVDYRWPAEVCLEASAQALPEKCRTDVPWLGVAELRENLEPLGVSVREEEDTVTLSFPDAQPVELSSLDFNPADYGSSPETLNIMLRSEQLQRGYYPLFEIVNAVANQADVPVKLSGWDNPRLRVGETTFQLGT